MRRDAPASCEYATSVVDPGPAGRPQQLQRAEAGLVVHLVAALDPVAQVDEGQGGLLGVADVVEDRERAQAAARLVRIEEAVDQRQAIPQLVHQRASGEVARP